MSGVIAGLAVSVGSAAMSFSQAAKQNKAMRAADRKASQMMEEARKKLEVKYTEALSAQKGVYEQARETLLQTGARGIEAGMEGETRGAAATVGRTVLGVEEAERGISAAQEQELMGIQKAQVEEAKALRDMGVQLDLGEVAGAQQASAQAQAMAEQAKMQGIQSAAGALQAGISLAVPTFNARAERQALASGAQLTPEQAALFSNVPDQLATVGTDIVQLPGQEFAETVETVTLDPSLISGMSKAQYRQFERGLTPEQQTALFGQQIPTFFQGIQSRSSDALDFMNPYRKTNKSNSNQALLQLASLLAAQQNQ